MKPIIIIGSGLAGYTVAREFRKLDKQAPLLILTADDGRFYSKPNLSNALALGKDAVTLANAAPEKMAEQLQAEIRTRIRVSSLDPQTGTVQIADGALAYSQLVLALGADPIRLPLEGDAAGEVLSVNDLGDYGVFRDVIETKKSIVIIGAGLIGCEFANDLRGAGYEVDVVDPAPWPLVRFLPEPAARALEKGLANSGVRWHLQTTVERVDRAKNSYRLRLADATEIQADVVLSAIGLRPRTQLAETAGIGTERGIVTNRLLQTGKANVYALGDCAEVEGLVLPFIMPIMHAGRALARTLAGEPTPLIYPAMPVVVKTPAHPVVVAPPAAGAQGEWHCEPVGAGVRALFRGPEGELLGMALTGEAVKEKIALSKALPAILQ